MNIKTDFRNLDGTFNSNAIALCTEVDDFAKKMIERHGNRLSLDSIGYLMATTAQNHIVMEIAMNVVEQKPVVTPMPHQPSPSGEPLTAVIKQDRFVNSRARTYCIHHFPEDTPAERASRRIAFADGYRNALADMNDAGGNRVVVS